MSADRIDRDDGPLVGASYRSVRGDPVTWVAWFCEQSRSGSLAVAALADKSLINFLVSRWLETKQARGLGPRACR